MTKREENRLSMYLTVQQTVNFHVDVWNEFTPFREQFMLFENLIDKVMQVRPIQEGKITGVTKEKAEFKNKAAIKGIYVAQKLTAYASIAGILKLKDRVKYTFNELTKSRDTFIINRLQVIIDAANNHISELSDYELTQADIDELSVLTNDFRKIVENPRQSITNRVRATIEIKQLLSEIDMTVKERLDNLVHHFKESSPAFWQQYKSARLIINLGHRKRAEKEGTKEAA